MSDAIPMPLNPASWPRRAEDGGRAGRDDQGERSGPRRDAGRPAEEGAAAAEGPRDDAAAQVAGAQATFGGEDREGEWVTVYIAFGPEEAHIVRQSLQLHDIPAIMRMDGLDTVVGTTLGRGVRVLVPRALEDRARSVLEGTRPDEEDDPSDLREPDALE